MWYSSRVDVDRGWVPPSRNTSDNSRGIRPSKNTSTYRHRAVGYGQSPYSNNVYGVQHCCITPGQRRHVIEKKALMETTCPTLGYSHLLILYKLPTLTVIILPELHHLQGAYKLSKQISPLHYLQ